MLYYLFLYLDREFDFIGAGVFHYISFRAGMAMVISLLITVVFGKKMINVIKKLQLSEKVRTLGLQGESKKEGTPTMGGIIIIAAIVIPTLLFSQVSNIYILLLIFSITGLGLVGFIDDYLKVKRKNKVGLRGQFKIYGQIVVGLIVGLTIIFHPDITIRKFDGNEYEDVKALVTTIPFFKGNEFNYSWFLPDFLIQYDWILYLFITVFIVIAMSNGNNISDGIDGLAAGICGIIGMGLAILTYLSGNVIFSEYLNIIFIPQSGELVIFCAALVGACIGFLWYNSYPAQVFMGDTGSLALGGTIAVLALVIRKELMLPVLCGVIVIENLSVIIQVLYFKYTKKKYGVGKRVFLMSPIHHHYQMKGIHEAKIVSRFWTLGILLAILTLATLKLR